MQATTGAPVGLTIRAEPSNVRLVRLVVSSVAADLDLDFEAVEDLRIAADELVSALITALSPSATVRVDIATIDGALEVRASGDTTGAGGTLDPLADQIVQSIVHTYELRLGGDAPFVAFRSRVAATAIRDY